MHGRGSGHDRSQGALDGERYRFWDLKSSAGGGFWERRATLLFVCMGGAKRPFWKRPLGIRAAYLPQTQFSVLTPGIRANSRMLLVTTINPSLRAWPPICMSCGPHGVPARSSSARTCP